jgi:putative ABC transport system substrate-binding protein
MRRRTFIAGLGSAAAWPVLAQAQQTTISVIGYLGAQSGDDDYKNFTVPFLQGLKENGYVEGQNVAVEYRLAENQFDRLPALAAIAISTVGTRKKSLPWRPAMRCPLSTRFVSTP